MRMIVLKCFVFLMKSGCCEEKLEILKRASFFFFFNAVLCCGVLGARMFSYWLYQKYLNKNFPPNFFFFHLTTQKKMHYPICRLFLLSEEEYNGFYSLCNFYHCLEQEKHIAKLDEEYRSIALEESCQSQQNLY